jgi:hypothetical protein
MPSQPNDSTKRRPVDVLFGDKDSHSSPNYLVESPQPITTVSPPSPDETAKPAQAPTPPPPISPKPAPAFSQSNGKPQMPVSAPTFVSSMPTTPPPMPHTAPSFDPEPVIAHPIAAPNQDRYVADMSTRIEKLYERVKQSTPDSRVVANDCMALLLKARQAYATRDYPHAEFQLQSVEARLQRSEASQQASLRVIVWIIVLWELIALAASGFAIAMSYIANLTLFGLPVLPEGIVLMRAITWGALGGAFGAMTSLASRIRNREYEASSNVGYFLRPVFGGILSSIFFLLSLAGIIGGYVVFNNTQLGPLFLYVFAVLIGFKQEAVIEILGNVVKTILGRK